MTNKKDNKGEKKPLKLSKKMLKDITALVAECKEKNMDDKAIRKEIFERFQIDITLYEFKFEPDKNVHSGPVDKDKQLVRAKDIKKVMEMTNYKHEFTDAEIRKKSEQLSNYIIEMSALEDQKKSIMSDFKAKIDAKQEQITELARVVNSGVEIRKAELQIVKDFGTGYKKGYLNGVCVLTEPLTQADHVQKIDFPNEDIF